MLILEKILEMEDFFSDFYRGDINLAKALVELMCLFFILLKIVRMILCNLIIF